MEKVLKKLDEVLLCKDPYSSNTEMAGLFLVDVASLFLNDLDQAQKIALEIAKAYWDKKATDEERLAQLQILCDRMDAFMHKGLNYSRPAIINRIVASSLMTTTGMSYDLCDFIADLTDKVGVPEKLMNDIFCKHIPEFVC